MLRVRAQVEKEAVMLGARVCEGMSVCVYEREHVVHRGGGAREDAKKEAAMLGVRAHVKRGTRAVPGAFVGEVAALC